MTNDFAESFHNSVLMFKAWAEKFHPEVTEDNDNGEWEPLCSEFDYMLSDGLKVIENIDFSNAAEQIADDLLYLIARDNEVGIVINKLLDYCGWFSILCQRSLHSPYTNAKWQFVEKLSEYNGDNCLKNLVYDFLNAGDEYTERMALKALADIYPQDAEKYAVMFWEREKFENSEYQKMMALDVLNKIHSPKLAHYLDEADKSDFKYLKESAKNIRRQNCRI